jgi:hypothetical protein
MTLSNIFIGNGEVKSSSSWNTYWTCYKNLNFGSSVGSSGAGSLPDLAGKSISAPTCEIDAEGSAPLLTCDSTAVPDEIFAGSAHYMSITDGVCKAGTEANDPKSSVSTTIQTTSNCRNEGSCTSTHCVRIDIKARGVSLFAAMFEVDSTVSYNSKGVFSAEVRTSAFTSTDESASAEVYKALNVSLGPCGDSSEPTAPFNIGDVASLCISSDESVKLSLISVDANPGNQNLITNGVANFVTSFNNTANPVTLSTLILPLYLDSFEGDEGRITINGTATIIYSRRLNGGRFLEEEEEGQFSVNIPLEKRPAPDVVDSLIEEENAGYAVGLGHAASVVFAVIVAMMI